MPRLLGTFAVTANAPFTIPCGGREAVGAVVLKNLSGYELQLQYGSASDIIAAHSYERLDVAALVSWDGNITVTPQQLANNATYAPSQIVVATAYAPGEYISAFYPMAIDRLSNVGNSVIVNQGSSVTSFTANTTPIQAGLPASGVTFGGAAAIAGDTSAGSASFDGTTGYVNCMSASLPSGSQAFSLECWLKISANPTTNVRVAMFLGMPNTAAGATISVNTTGQVGGGIWGQTSPANSAAISLNVWHHVVLTFSGGTNGSTLLYVDGTATGVATTNTPNIASTPTFTLASPNGSASVGYFPGSLAEAAIYGAALSGTRVTAHYNAGTSSGYTSAVTADTPLRYYRLNEPSGATYVNSDISSTISLGNSDGSHALGRLATVGGQATSGTLGAPVIVAQLAPPLHITTTTFQTVLQFAVPLDGLYRASLHASIGATGGAITANINYTEASLGLGVTRGYFTWLGNPNALLNGATTITNQGVATQPITCYAKGGTSLTVNYGNGSGTPNDYISAMIERLT